MNFNQEIRHTIIGFAALGALASVVVILSHILQYLGLTYGDIFTLIFYLCLVLLVIIIAWLLGIIIDMFRPHR